ncbi:MAG: rhodanese-like domain-containing protein [Halieaceae bacterium]|jgi:phage shock protein E|nr:rhodanese-like domain-containing protein [Halieaceae bacterium]
MNRIVQACFFLAALLAGTSAGASAPADAVWIDVRTPAEYNRGHLTQAQLIPFDGIEAGVARLGLAKDTPIYLYCAVGGRAEKARQSLLAQGYSDVTNAGGLEDARQLADESQTSP